jgi:general secretion pathway protein C
MGARNDNGLMSARLAAFVIWAAVAASAVFWLLRLSASSPAAPSHTVAVASAGAPRGDLARVLGAPPVAAGPAVVVAEPALASRFKLIGVAAPREGGQAIGLALIAVDGKPARGFKVGAAIEGDLVLQSVTQRTAALGAAGGATALKLELPPLPLPATSNRPPGAGPALGAPPLPVFNPAGPPTSPAPIATLPPQVGVPPASETQEPVPVPPPPGQQGQPSGIAR